MAMPPLAAGAGPPALAAAAGEPEPAVELEAVGPAPAAAFDALVRAPALPEAPLLGLALPVVPVAPADAALGDEGAVCMLAASSRVGMPRSCDGPVAAASPHALSQRAAANELTGRTSIPRSDSRREIRAGRRIFLFMNHLISVGALDLIGSLQASRTRAPRGVRG